MAARLIDTIEIRRMKSMDLADVVAIETTSYDFPWSEKILKDCILQNYDCYVAEGLKIVGYVIANITSQESHVLNLTIDSDYRGFGLGSSFIDLVVNECKIKKSHSIFLESRVSNTIARNLYQKYGFRSIGIRKNYYRNSSGREDAVVYRKNIEY